MMQKVKTEADGQKPGLNPRLVEDARKGLSSELFNLWMSESLELLRLRENYTHLKGQYNLLYKQHQENEKAISECRAQAEHFNRESAALRKQAEELRVALAEKESQIKHLTSRSGVLGDEIKELKKWQESLSPAMQRLANEIKILQDVAESKSENLRAKITELENKNVEMSQKIQESILRTSENQTNSIKEIVRYEVEAVVKNTLGLVQPKLTQIDEKIIAQKEQLGGLNTRVVTAVLPILLNIEAILEKNAEAQAPQAAKKEDKAKPAEAGQTPPVVHPGSKDKKQIILSHIKTNPGLDYKALLPVAGGYGISPDMLRKFLQSLVEKGLLRKGDTWPPRYYSKQ